MLIKLSLTLVVHISRTYVQWSTEKYIQLFRPIIIIYHFVQENMSNWITSFHNYATCSIMLTVPWLQFNSMNILYCISFTIVEFHDHMQKPLELVSSATQSVVGSL